MIELVKIRTDGGTQSRAEISQETVADYAEAMADPEAVFPPAVVYYDGKDYWLADGFHRLAAWAQIGRVEVPADVRQGTRRDAILHACAANSAHGLRRTNEDKRRAILTLLEDDEWAAWSDREIARRVRVHHSTVAKYRAELMGVTGYLASEPRTYTTKHGTEATMRPAQTGAKSKPDQEQVTTSAPQENIAQTPVEPDQGTAQTPADQEPEPTPDPYGYAKLTEVALLDLANGLRADLDDEKAKRKAAQAEVKSLKAQLRDFIGDDKDEVIRRLQNEVKNAGNAKWKALEDRDAYHRQLHAVKKERDAALKSLAAQEVPI